MHHHAVISHKFAVCSSSYSCLDFFGGREKMKKLFLFCLLGFFGFAVLCSYTPSYAYIIPTEAPSLSVGDEIKFEHGLGTTNGGEFLVKDVDGKYIYTTFCLERNEYLNYEDTFEIYDISDAAEHGGVSGDDPDEISPQTAYLYHQFFWGEWESYKYDDSGYADALQTAIWYFEDELGDKGSFYSSLEESDLTKDFIDEALGAGWTDCADVAVMNIVWPTGWFAQSQLIVVPEPDTMVLLGLGLISLVGIGRTRFRLRGKRD
jgi:hypothetical protein